MHGNTHSHLFNDEKYILKESSFFFKLFSRETDYLSFLVSSII